MTELKIKDESTDTAYKLLCIRRKYKTVTVLCVNGKEYEQTFDREVIAIDAMGIDTIVVEWGWAEINERV